MASQTKLLTLKFYFLKFFELVTRCEKKLILTLEFVNSRFFKKNNISEL